MEIKTPIHLDNSLTELVAGVRASSLLTGGSDLSDYGTIARSNNYSLLTLNRIILTYLYTGNGIFQTAIQLPIQDAVAGGVDVESKELSAEQIDDLNEWTERQFNNQEESSTPWETIINTFSWARLYGGGGLVTNNAENPEIPLDISNLSKAPLELYDVDRWQMDFGTFLYRDDPVFQDWISKEFFYIHGVKFHESRILRVRGKKAPYYVRRQLRGWGMSEGERMIRALNLFLKTEDVLYEILDESKLDVYKIKNFASKLIQKGGTLKIQERIALANQLKNYTNALIIDMEEEYQQKTMAYSGIAEVMRENRIGMAAALRMPMTKLFGLSASGFNTGEADLENYNKMIESEIRTPMRPLIRKVLAIGCSHLFGKIPKFKFKYKKLRIITAQEEENILTNQQTRALMMYDRNMISKQEFIAIGEKDGWVAIALKYANGKPEYAKDDQPVEQEGKGKGKDPKEPETKKIEEEPWFQRRKKPR